MAGVVRYRGPSPDRQTSDPFHILSLSGGGYRGLFTAVVLEELEGRAGKPLRECFDLIAGTSIGGILACGVALGVPAARMRKEFEEHGPAVFDRHLRFRGKRLFAIPRLGLFQARYSRRGLETAVDAVLGATARQTLGAVGKPLIVPAVSVTNANAVLFETGATAGGMAGTTIRDVAFATSAAPTYLPEHAIGPNSLVDGGIIANAPDAIAVMKAMSTWGRRPDELRLLSIGTAAERTGEAYRPGRRSGVLPWFLARGLFDLTLNAQQELATGLVKELLGSRNIRIDAPPDRAKANVTGLDRVHDAATDALVNLARKALADVDDTSGADLSAMLRHAAMT